MKSIVAAVLALAVVSVSALPFLESQKSYGDVSSAIPIQDAEGFWDGRSPVLGELFKVGKEAREQMERSGRIIGGEIPEPNSIPWQVALLRGGFLCGGSIIGGRVVLTAAHCIPGTVATEIIAGGHDRTVQEANQQRRIASSDNYRLHPAYNPNNLNNDIGLILVPMDLLPFEMNQAVQSIGLAPGTTGTLAGARVTVSGWGRTSNTGAAGNPPAILRTVDVNVITNAACAAVYGGTVNDGTICTSTAEGTGTCGGDSGGPVTYLIGGERRVCGAVSFGAAAGCVTAAAHPSGHARVSFFYVWILENSWQ